MTHSTQNSRHNTNQKALGSRFQNLLARAQGEGKPVILDGGTGTELDNRGMETGSPLWSGEAAINHPSLLENIHREYVQSGAEIITTATFRTTARAFAAANKPADMWKKATARAVSIAKKAIHDQGLPNRGAQNRVLVAGSVAPLEDCFLPELAPGGESARQEHALLCAELVAAGVDLLLLETFGTLREIAAAMDVARETTSSRSLPFALSVTTNRTGALISGEPLGEAFALADSNGASAFLVNCVPPSHVRPALDALGKTATTRLPIGVYPNMGRADANQDWKGSAYLPPEAFAREAKQWHAAGATIIGGCCGSSPDHIRALSESFHPSRREDC